MRYAARRRLRKVEDKLAGKGSPWHRAAHLVARQGMPAAEAAGAMAMPLPAFLGILRQALEDLASIYGPAGGRVA